MGNISQSTTLCANSNYFIWAESHFMLHFDRLTNKVMVSALQAISQLVEKTSSKLEGGSWDHSD